MSKIRLANIELGRPSQSSWSSSYAANRFLQPCRIVFLTKFVLSIFRLKVATLINFSVKNKYARVQFFSFLDILTWSTCSSFIEKTKYASLKYPVVFNHSREIIHLFFIYWGWVQNVYRFRFHFTHFHLLLFSLDVPAFAVLRLLLRWFSPCLCQAVFSRASTREHRFTFTNDVHMKRMFDHALLQTCPCFPVDGKSTLELMDGTSAFNFLMTS